MRAMHLGIVPIVACGLVFAAILQTHHPRPHPAAPSGQASSKVIGKGALAWEGTSSHLAGYGCTCPMWVRSDLLLVRGPQYLQQIIEKQGKTWSDAGGADSSYSRSVRCSWGLAPDVSRCPVQIGAGGAPCEANIPGILCGLTEVIHTTLEIQVEEVQGDVIQVRGDGAGTTHRSYPPWSYEISLVNGDGFASRTMVLAPQAGGMAPKCATLSPGGYEAAFAAGSSIRVASWDPATSRMDPKLVTEIGHANSGSWPVWDRSGSRVAWACDGKLYVHTRDTGTVVSIDLDGLWLSCRTARSGGWSADGRYLAAVAFASSSVTDPGNGSFSAAGWGYRGIAIVDTKLGSVRVIPPRCPTAFREYSPVWSHVGHRLAIAGTDCSIRVIDVDAGEDQVLPCIWPKKTCANDAGWDEQCLDWSPDDSAVAFGIPYEAVYVIDIPKQKKRTGTASDGK